MSNGELLTLRREPFIRHCDLSNYSLEISPTERYSVKYITDVNQYWLSP